MGLKSEIARLPNVFMLCIFSLSIIILQSYMYLFICNEEEKIMKNLAKFIFTAILVATPLLAKDNIKINFDRMDSYNRSIPAINLAYKSKAESKIAFILSYANTVFDFEHTLIEHFKITDTRLVLSYRF